MKRAANHRINLFANLFTLKALYLFIIVCWLVISYFFLRQLKISTVICQIDQQPCPDQFKPTFQPLIGKSIFFTDYDLEISQLLENQPVLLLKVQKKMPNQLIVYLQSIEPAYNLQLTDKTISLDSSGNILTQQMPDLPTVLVKNNCPIINNNQVNLKIHAQVILLWQQLKNKGLTPQQVSCLSPDLIIVSFRDSPQFLLHPEALAEQTQKLIILDNSLQLETFNPPIKEVDLRFNQPVLRENPTSLDSN